MKQYPKVYEDIVRDPSNYIIDGISTSFSSLDELSLRFKDFLRQACLTLFDLYVKDHWLEGQFKREGVPRRIGRKSGPEDVAFAYFMRKIVGITQQSLNSGFYSRVVPTYFIDFFPKFFEHDPFKEPEYYKFPYQHVSLDHLVFVYQCHNRMEMLSEAEDKKMSIKDFMNWATNWELSYDEEMMSSGKKKMYVMNVRNTDGDNTHYIKRLKKKPVKKTVYE